MKVLCARHRNTETQNRIFFLERSSSVDEQYFQMRRTDCTLLAAAKHEKHSHVL
jgi:hypothetical protein